MFQKHIHYTGNNTIIVKSRRIYMRKRIIVIKTKIDYIKFIKSINLYKSFLFYNTEFQLKGTYQNEKMLQIIKGLNIKRRKERIKYVYDTACNIIDNNIAGENICGFKNGKCYIQQKQNNNKCNGCCRMCKYQSKNGCPTKNLACKLFNCSEVKQRHKIIEYKDLDLLKLLSLKNRLIVKSDYFTTREEVLKDLYPYTLTYSILRILFRIIVDSIAKIRKRM